MVKEKRVRNKKEERIIEALMALIRLSLMGWEEENSLERGE